MLTGMENKKSYLAFDLGATSGRCILGTLDDAGIKIEELTRFKNSRVKLGTHQYWNIYNLFDEIKTGLAFAAKRGVKISSVGIDTWGVDFVCVGNDGTILGLPHSYRDPMTFDAKDEYLSKYRSSSDLYFSTGIQLMNFNSLFQLYAMKREGSSVLSAADRILFLPDALAYMLTGTMSCEFTIASTSQLLDPHTRQPDRSLLKEIGLSEDLVGEVSLPGRAVGMIRNEILREVGIDYQVPVVSVAGHDTADAIAAIPASDDNFVFLSSGTWSLMGVELPEPVIDRRTYDMAITNEGGFAGRTELLKNLTGMWILEECMREWENKRGVKYSYSDIASMTGEVPSFASLIDTDAAVFSNPESMTSAIKDFCSGTGQAVPVSDADFVSCIFASLSLKYRETIDLFRQLAPCNMERLHIIGGGSKNQVMSKYTSDATGIPVIAGPTEASAIGNILIQAYADGVVATLEEMRKLVSDSVDTKMFMPEKTLIWDAAYARYKKILNK